MILVVNCIVLGFCIFNVDFNLEEISCMDVFFFICFIDFIFILIEWNIVGIYWLLGMEGYGFFKKVFGG